MRADSIDVYTGNANRELAGKIARYLGRELGKAEVFAFANENIFVKILDNVREKDIFLVQPTCRPVNQSIMELLILIDAFKRASAGRITAVIPYYSYGRSDKKDQPRVPITARLIADMVTVAGADRVLTMDLHQGQIQGFFNIPVDELTAVHLLSNYFKQKQIADPVVVTDLGFAKRARTFAELLDACEAYAAGAGAHTLVAGVNTARDAATAVVRAPKAIPRKMVPSARARTARLLMSCVGRRAGAPGQIGAEYADAAHGVKLKVLKRSKDPDRKSVV